MSIRAFRRAKARRAAESSTGDHDLKAILGNGLAALAVSVLGLAVFGSVTLTSAAQSTDQSPLSALSVSDPDTTRAVPATQAQDLSASNRASLQESKRQAGTEEGDSGTLDTFSDRQTRASRNAVRVELDKALSAQKASARSTTLSQVDQQVAANSRKAVQGKRTKSLKETSEEINTESKRLAEEARKKAEEERKKAEAADGSLVGGSTSAAVTSNDDVDVSQISGSGGAYPIAKGSYTLLARWGQVGSWSRYHTGLDLAAPLGTPIHAAADGVVVSPGNAGWAGIHVVIKHADGSYTLYAHMAHAVVSPGQTVKAGQLIGVVGMTGRTFGPHCHFEWYPAGGNPGTDPYTSKDPYPWMLAHGIQL